MQVAFEVVQDDFDQVQLSYQLPEVPGERQKVQILLSV